MYTLRAKSAILTLRPVLGIWERDDRDLWRKLSEKWFVLREMVLRENYNMHDKASHQLLVSLPVVVGK